MLTNKETALLYAIVDRGDGCDEIPGFDWANADALFACGLVNLGDKYARPTDAGRLVADLLRQPAPRWPINANEEGWAKNVSRHPAQYVPEDPTWVVGVLGKDCPDTHEWRWGTSIKWMSANSARLGYSHTFGMIRPIPRPEMILTVPTDATNDEVLVAFRAARRKIND